MAVLAATLPGMPLVYSGQEDGLDRRLKFFDRDPIVWKDFGRAGFYQNLAALKHRHPALQSALQEGNLEIIETANPDVFAFRRVKGSDQVRVVVNLAGREAQVSLPGGGGVTLKAWGWLIDTPGAVSR
jgi:glycosidase